MSIGSLIGMMAKCEKSFLLKKQKKNEEEEEKVVRT